MENEAKFVGSYSGLLFELGISLNDPVRARKFSKPKKSRDFNFCQTELLSKPLNCLVLKRVLFDYLKSFALLHLN